VNVAGVVIVLLALTGTVCAPMIYFAQVGKHTWFLKTTGVVHEYMECFSNFPDSGWFFLVFFNK
jgi:hypothetical protein